MCRGKLIGCHNTVGAWLAELQGVVPERGHRARRKAEVAWAGDRDLRQLDLVDVREVDVWQGRAQRRQSVAHTLFLCLTDHLL